MSTKKSSSKKLKWLVTPMCITVLPYASNVTFFFTLKNCHLRHQCIAWRTNKRFTFSVDSLENTLYQLDQSAQNNLSIYFLSFWCKRRSDYPTKMPRPTGLFDTSYNSQMLGMSFKCGANKLKIAERLATKMDN